MRKRGFIQILPLLLIVGIIIVLAILIQKKVIPFNINLSSPTPTSTSTPTSSPTPVPTPTLTPTPTIVATATPTFKPTPAPVTGPPGAGYSYITVHTEKGDFAASVLSIDLNSARMITDTGNDSECTDNCTVSPLKDYVTRDGGFAGVNGTYFCPAEYPECSSKKNSYDFPVYNTRLGKWINGGNLSWNSRSMVYVDGSGAHYIQNANGFSGGLTAGIVNYPGLVNGGNVQIDDNQSGLADKQKAKGTKVGIGVRGSKNVMIVVAYNVNMQEFAFVFKSLSADGALNLDTGGSTALYYNGSYLAGPGRNIPNAIIFAR
ncbi:MAG TPA: phosphodiester glycosidase family protein [Patescibacteria group bacterium]